MFSKQAFSALLLLLTSVTLWSCKKDSEPAPAAPASMECKVNNVAWKAATFNNTLVTMQMSGYSGKRLDIRGTAADGTTIILSVSEPTTTAPGSIKPDTYHMNVFLNLPPNYQSGTPVKGALGTYMTMLAQKLFMTNLESEGQIVITACDATNKTVSGTFSFEATDFNDGTLSVTAGTFTNLSYK
jgi:hypothetical protein